MASKETPGQRLDRKIEERNSAGDKAKAAARQAAVDEQRRVDDAIRGVTRDADGDPKPIGS